MNGEAHPGTGDRFFRRLVGAAALLLAAVVLFRFTLVESTAMADLCDHGGGPWWCAPRNAVIHVSYLEVPGAIGLVAGIAALLLRSRAAAVVAVLVGGWGMALYSAGTGAVGFLLGLLAALRCRSPGAGPDRRASDGTPLPR